MGMLCGISRGSPGKEMSPPSLRPGGGPVLLSLEENCVLTRGLWVLCCDPSPTRKDEELVQ